MALGACFTIGYYLCIEVAKMGWVATWLLLNISGATLECAYVGYFNKDRVNELN